MGGLTTDRRENIHSLDSMTRDEIVARLSQLQKQYPQVFIEGNFKKVEDDDRKKSVDRLKNLPENSFATRLESRIANGVPDVHIIWDVIFLDRIKDNQG